MSSRNFWFYGMVFGVGQLNGVIYSYPWLTHAAMATKFGTKWTTTRPAYKIHTPYFRSRTIRWCHLNFSFADPRCHGNVIWDKIDYNSICVKDICKMFSSVESFWGWAIKCCQQNFSPNDFRCHSNNIWNTMG